MTYDQFVGEVQHRAQLGSLGDAVGAIRVTLEALAECLAMDEAENLASQLPREVGIYLLRSVLVEPVRPTLDEFLEAITLDEGIDAQDAIYQARVVLEMLGETVSPEALAPLPQAFRDFMTPDSQGQFKKAA